MPKNLTKIGWSYIDFTIVLFAHANIRNGIRVLYSNMPGLFTKRRPFRVYKDRTITKGDVDTRYGEHISSLMYTGRIEAYETARFLAQFCYLPDKATLDQCVENIRSKINIEYGAFAVCKALDEYYNQTYGNLRIFYFVSTATHNNFVVYRSPWRPNCLNLFVYQTKRGANDGSYYVISDVRKFFFGHFEVSGYTYCPDCNSLSDKKCLEAHTKKCPNMCHSCFRWGAPCPEDLPVTCTKCHRYFPNKECFNFHFTKPLCGTPGKIEKGKSWKCLECSQEVLSLNFKRPNTEHICYEAVCWSCFSIHLPDQECIKRKGQDVSRF